MHFYLVACTELKPVKFLGCMRLSQRDNWEFRRVIFEKKL